MAGGGGLEPPLPGPEPGVLPLDDPPGSPQRRTIRTRSYRSVNARDAREPKRRQRTAIFSARLARNFGTRAPGIVMTDPLRGWRPYRVARRATTNVPKPEIVTGLP